MTSDDSTPGVPWVERVCPRRAPTWLAAALLLLGGCASLQQPPGATPADAAADVPARWQHAAAADSSSTTSPAALAAWWRRFDDAALAPLVEQALLANTDIQIAQARLRQSRVQVDLAAAALLPTLGGSGSAQASRSQGRSTTEQYRVGLDAGWEADLWGGQAAALRAAEAGVRAGSATLGGTQVAVAAEVALNLLQLRGTQARLAIARNNLASQQQTLQIVTWRAEAGLVTQLDVVQARSALEQTRAQIPALETGVAQFRHALAVLTGQAPAALDAALAAAEPALAPVAPPDLALALPAEVLRQRPDLRAAEQQWLAAAARVEQADAQRLPSLSLGGSIGLNALSLGALGGGGAGVASLLASVSLPLFDGGRLGAQVRQQEAARDEAQAVYRATLLAALREVEDSLVALQNTRRQLSALQEAQRAARTAADLAEQRYRSGLVDFQNVLQSQRSLLAAEDGVANTATSLATLHVRLYKALGGGWEPEPPITSPR